MGSPWVTAISFLHVDQADQTRVADHTIRAARRLEGADGNVAINVLRSLEGSRVMTYGQWTSERALLEAQQQTDDAAFRSLIRPMLQNEAIPRFYSVVYTDDRSDDGVSIISAACNEAIFVNEITTQPDTQDRLLELVIRNNEVQSQHIPGYRSANFHKSTDGQRAVNYSLWDTPEHCIEAISAMADMDANLEETVNIAGPDFRFYTLVHASHI